MSVGNEFHKRYSYDIYGILNLSLLAPNHPNQYIEHEQFLGVNVLNLNQRKGEESEKKS
jgi:hypothetical protein